MPAASPASLVQAVLRALEESDHSGVLISSVRAHPRKFIVTTRDEQSLPLWVYIWTLTPGGRPSLPDEYRIQKTGVASPLPANPNGPTIVIGYEPGLQAFGGFDLRHHTTFTEGSSSAQIKYSTVRQALQDGLAFDRKDNDEIAIGIRPDQFMTYVYNAPALHVHGSKASVLGLLTRAAALQPITEAEVEPLPEDRRRIVATVSRLSRLANFRQQVLFAYGSRCAVTRAQLRLVDAAHILPVGAPGSSDTVNNGLALAPTYHRAFDSGLIYLSDKLEMKINPSKEAQLRLASLDGGLDGFKAHLGQIFLPPDNRQWPSAAAIRQANQFRQIPGQ